MADSTELRVSTSVEMFHKIGASGDSPEHTTSTTEQYMKNGRSGSSDYKVESDNDLTVVQELLVAPVLGGAEIQGSDSTFLASVIIKHLGFTDDTKATKSTDSLKVGLGSTYDAGVGFILAPGDVRCFNSPSVGNDQLNKIYFESDGSDTIYLELLGVI